MRYLCVFLYCACFSCVSVLANEGKIIFRDRHKLDQAPVEPTQTFRTARSMPLDMIMKLNAITNEDEFINQFIEPDPSQSLQPSTSFRKPHMVPQSGVSRRVSRLTDARHLARDTEVETPQIALAYSLSGASPSSNNRLGDGVATSRFGGNEQTENTNEKKNTVPTPKPANCQPELRTVALKDHDDPTLFYFPSCTRADRCGGCCSHELLTCQPIAVEYKNFSVIVAQYNGGHKLEMKGRKTVTVETHTKCKCDCKIKPKDCTALQEYKKNECRCICTNKDEESKCSKDRMRLWNPSACTCQCREVRECSTGLSFDEITCSCVPSNKQFSPSYNIDRNGYKVGYPEQ